MKNIQYFFINDSFVVIQWAATAVHSTEPLDNPVETRQQLFQTAFTDLTPDSASSTKDPHESRTTSDRSRACSSQKIHCIAHTRTWG